MAPTVASALGLSELPDTWQGVDVFGEQFPAVPAVCERAGYTSLSENGSVKAVFGPRAQKTAIYDLTAGPESEDTHLEGDAYQFADSHFQGLLERYLEQAPPTLTPGDQVLTEEDEARLLETLKALGYVE
jgi:hypothetical protein